MLAAGGSCGAAQRIGSLLGGAGCASARRQPKGHLRYRPAQAACSKSPALRCTLPAELPPAASRLSTFHGVYGSTIANDRLLNPMLFYSLERKKERASACETIKMLSYKRTVTLHSNPLASPQPVSMIEGGPFNNRDCVICLPLS